MGIPGARRIIGPIKIKNQISTAWHRQAQESTGTVSFFATCLIAKHNHQTVSRFFQSLELQTLPLQLEFHYARNSPF